MRAALKPNTKLLAFGTAALLLAAFLWGVPMALPAASAQQAPAQGDVFAYRFQLEDAPFALPFAVAELEAAGWQTATPAHEPFAPGQYCRLVYQKQDAILTATVANRGGTPTTLAGCDVTGIAANQNGGADLTLAPGLALGAGRAEVLQLCGVPDGGDENAAILRYTTGRHNWLQFGFDENGSLCEIELTCWEEPAAPTVWDDLPAEVLAYQTPVALENRWQSYGIEYAGHLYTLPAPVATFLDNGWTLLDDGTLPAGGWALGARLQKGNQILRTRLQNFSGAEAPYVGCFVTVAESSALGANLPLTLAGGIGHTSSYEEITAAMGPPHRLFQTSTVMEASYFTQNGQVVFSFSAQDGQLYALTVSHQSLSRDSGEEWLPETEAGL